MADNSSIEWTEATWNPVTGCTKISPGCDHCYAERMAKRLRAMGNRNYANGFDVTLQPQMMERPLEWRSPRTIFVNSMSDLFHKDVPDAYIRQVFDVMRKAHWHQFQVLTKRSARLLRLNSQIEWPTNVWMGVSVESKEYSFRIDHLRLTSASIKFLSIEPLIGPIEKLNLSNIDWAIVGGESGPGARPCFKEWVVNIRKQCQESGVPFFFKQWGGFNKKRSGRELDGRTWDEYPKPRSSVIPLSTATALTLTSLTPPAPAR
jgi:protein gp37